MLLLRKTIVTITRDARSRRFPQPRVTKRHLIALITRCVGISRQREEKESIDRYAGSVFDPDSSFARRLRRSIHGFSSFPRCEKSREPLEFIRGRPKSGNSAEWGSGRGSGTSDLERPKFFAVTLISSSLAPRGSFLLISINFFPFFSILSFFLFFRCLFSFHFLLLLLLLPVSNAITSSSDSGASRRAIGKRGTDNARVIILLFDVHARRPRLQ